MRARVAVLWKRYRVYHFKALTGRNLRFRSTTEMLKAFIFRLLTSLGIRVFEPGGREFESLRAHQCCLCTRNADWGRLLVDPNSNSQGRRPEGVRQLGRLRPSWTPLRAARRRAGAQRRPSGAAASNPSGRTNFTNSYPSFQRKSSKCSQTWATTTARSGTCNAFLFANAFH